jgi:hypothetical protein
LFPECERLAIAAVIVAGLVVVMVMMVVVARVARRVIGAVLGLRDADPAGRPRRECDRRGRRQELLGEHCVPRS